MILKLRRVNAPEGPAMISHFSFPTNIVFGVGAVKETGALAKGLGGTRALIVSDRGVVKAGLIEPVRNSLEFAGIRTALFDGITPNPTEQDVEHGIAVYREHGGDIIVGVGGGSALDGAKAIRLRATH